MADRLHPLEQARREVELSIDELWMRYFALGGMSTASDRIQADMASLERDYGYVFSLVDESSSRLRVGVVEPTDDIRSALEEEYAMPVDLVHADPAEFVDEHYPPVALSCVDNTRDHCNPLRGGTRIRAGGLTGARCTIGFIARTSSGNNYVLTARHCLSSSAPKDTHSGDAVGVVSTVGQQSGNADAGRILISSNWSTSRWIYQLSGSQALQVTNVFPGTGGSTGLASGTGVCVAAGATNNYLCGHVLDGDVDGAGFNDMLAYGMCTQGGDSGSPVMISSQAIAIHKGNIPSSVGIIPPLGACAKWGTYAANAQAATNLTIRTS